MQEPVRKLLADFVEWAHDTGRASKLAANSGRYIAILTKLDSELPPNAVSIDQTVIETVMNTEAFRRSGLLGQFLTHTGLVLADSDERRLRSEDELLQRKLIQAQANSWGRWISDFHRHLKAEATKPLSVRSQIRYVHAATELLLQSRPISLADLNSSHIKLYLRRRPGQKASISRFLRYVEIRVGTSLDAAQPRKRPDPMRKNARTVRYLMEWLEPSRPDSAHRALLAKLIATLYGTTLEGVLRMRHSDVSIQSEATMLRLRAEWIQVDQRIEPLIRMGVRGSLQQGQDFDPWLFPGRNHTDHLSAAAVKYHLKKIVKTAIF